VGAARRTAASGGIISCVLDGNSQILDWGRTKRLFTPTQRLALVERDGGCAICGHHPGIPRSTTSGGGRGMPDPPTWPTACCSANPATTASTTTDGTSESTAPAPGPRSGSSPHHTSTPHELLGSADEPATTTPPDRSTPAVETQAPTYTLRCFAVRVSAFAIRSAGVPSNTIAPPSCPAPGPRSMIQSAWAITAW
jgi:hypothetical protein